MEKLTFLVQLRFDDGLLSQLQKREQWRKFHFDCQLNPPHTELDLIRHYRHRVSSGLCFGFRIHSIHAVCVTRKFPTGWICQWKSKSEKKMRKTNKWNYRGRERKKQKHFPINEIIFATKLQNPLIVIAMGFQLSAANGSQQQLSQYAGGKVCVWHQQARRGFGWCN